MPYVIRRYSCRNDARRTRKTSSGSTIPPASSASRGKPRARWRTSFSAKRDAGTMTTSTPWSMSPALDIEKSLLFFSISFSDNVPVSVSAEPSSDDPMIERSPSPERCSSRDVSVFASMVK